MDNEKVVIRAVMTQEEADALVNEIPAIEELAVLDDKQREKCYREAIRSGDPREWIRIIKTSYFRQQDRRAKGKKVTAVDERYFHAAEDQLYAELSVSLGIAREDVRGYIQERVPLRIDGDI